MKRMQVGYETFPCLFCLFRCARESHSWPCRRDAGCGFRGGAAAWPRVRLQRRRESPGLSFLKHVRRPATRAIVVVVTCADHRVVLQHRKGLAEVCVGRAVSDSLSSIILDRHRHRFDKKALDEHLASAWLGTRQPVVMTTPPYLVADRCVGSARFGRPPRETPSSRRSNLRAMERLVVTILAEHCESTV